MCPCPLGEDLLRKLPEQRAQHGCDPSSGEGHSAPEKALSSASSGQSTACIPCQPATDKLSPSGTHHRAMLLLGPPAPYQLV